MQTFEKLCFNDKKYYHLHCATELMPLLHFYVSKLKGKMFFYFYICTRNFLRNANIGEK